MTKNFNTSIIKSVLVLFCAFSLQTIQAQTRLKNRAYDGRFNNLTNLKWGGAGFPLHRELPAEYGSSDPLNALGGASRPSAREISNKLSSEHEDVQNVRDMSGMFYIWGQFLDHDMSLTPTGTTESAPISLPSSESIFTSPISFKRSLVHPETGVTSSREQTNLQTSWIDASQVYGADVTTARWLRVFAYGKLRVSQGNFLPFNTLSGEYNSPIDPFAPRMADDEKGTKKAFVAGDTRASEHPGLTSLHILFVREHNRICDRLRAEGMYSDEEMYQKARKEIGALMQVITYGQWLSSLGVNLSSYTGYNPTVRPDIMNTFATAAYRWHTMVENDIIFRDNDCHGVGPVELPLKDVFFNNSFVRTYNIGVLLKGLSVHQQYETDLKVNDGLRNFLFGPGSGLDLVSLNLQRGRDHGLPHYNAVRAYYTGSAATSFNDITSNSSTASDMQSLYGNVDNIDLWVGLFAEPHLSGKSVGKTLDAIIRAQFEKLRDGDYYYYLNDPYLAADISRLQSTTLGDLIARNSTAGNLQSNVFFRKHCTPAGDDIATSLVGAKNTEILELEAHAEPSRAVIEWVNNTGYKNDYFILEKMNPNTGDFEQVDIINAPNKDISTVHSTVYDNVPTEGDNTYHIKAVYKDGSARISEAKTLTFKGLSGVRVFPNPAHDAVNIDLGTYKNQAVEVSLYNYLGQLRSVHKIDKVENTVLNLDIANEQSGHYMIRVKSKGKQDATKYVVIAH
jgi:peroxidase